MRPWYILAISFLSACRAHLYEGLHSQKGENWHDWNSGSRTCVQRYNPKEPADGLEGCLEVHFHDGITSTDKGTVSSTKTRTKKSYGALIDAPFQRWSFNEIEYNLRVGSAAQLDIVSGNLSFDESRNLDIPQADMTFLIRPFIEQEIKYGYFGFRFGLWMPNYNEFSLAPNIGVGLTYPKD